MAYKARKRKVKKNIPVGCAHIKASFNNTIVTITDVDGNAISWSAPGAVGFKSAKKSTPYAAQVAAEAAAKAAEEAAVEVPAKRSSKMIDIEADDK